MNIFDKCDLFYKLARRPDDIEILKSNIGNWIHFSDSERFGISYHKGIHGNNPRGLYGFPLTSNIVNLIEHKKYSDAIEGYQYNKYIYIFGVNGNILNIDTASKDDLFERIQGFILSYYKGKVDAKELAYLRMLTLESFKNWQNKVSLMSALAKFYEEIKYLKGVNDKHSFMNIIWRGIGVDAIYTSKEAFEDDIKSQIVVLTPSSINLIDKIDNPMISKVNPNLEESIT